ncbi:MAG TPA: sulfotransferase [Kofleriaceae bacterium]|nr:sulfotransferase [Kofleriaceae bacterium]
MTAAADLSIAAVHAAASAATGGLTDFGPVDYKAPLAALLDPADVDRLDGPGRALLRHIVTSALVARLWIALAHAERPGAAAISIERPLFIVGLPRTGSSLLHQLLALAPDARAPLLWETMSPGAALVAPDEARAAAAGLCAARPAELHAVHPLRPDGPAECYWLLRNSLRSSTFCHQADRPIYRAWLAASDMEVAYRDHRRQLQLLLHARPAARLVLKMPGHVDHLEPLLAVFPGACIVHLHRDPVAALASSCNLWRLIARSNHQPVDPHRIGARLHRRFARSIERGMAARRAVDPARVIDVHHAELARDPAAAVDRIHRHFDLPRPPELAGRIARAVTGPPPPRHPALADYGLDPAAVRRGFAGYCRAFAVAPESNAESAADDAAGEGP